MPMAPRLLSKGLEPATTFPTSRANLIFDVLSLHVAQEHAGLAGCGIVACFLLNRVDDVVVRRDKVVISLVMLVVSLPTVTETGVFGAALASDSVTPGMSELSVLLELLTVMAPLPEPSVTEALLAA